MKIWTLVLTAVLALAGVDAEAAKRLGGGKSVGQQSSNVNPRDATAGSPAGAQQAQKSAAQPGAAAAAAPPQRSRFGGMLAGLAAGLGLAWLAHTLGFGEAFANILLFGLLALAVMVAVGWFLRSRRGAPASNGPFAFQAAGAAPDAATPTRTYNPDKIGNDASARPWERSSMAFEAAKYANAANPSSVRIGSALEGTQNWGVPAGFDTQGFIEAAKRNFVTLQGAWDRSDVATLRSMMTDEMTGEIGKQLAEREALGGPPGRTEVVMLEAQLLGIEDRASDYMASVEFSGMLREDPSSGPSPFREVWNMTKPKNGASGWLVAGVQALQ